jgi:hypothetical protein
MPMPAVTLQNSTVHNNQNWGVRIAVSAETLAVVTIDLAFVVDGSYPWGFQSSAGTLMVKAPNIMNAR